VGDGVSRHSVVDAGEKVSARLGAGVNGAPSPEILATSAVREAENGEDLVGCVREATGLKMRLISGEKEAELGFRGALSAVRHEGKVLVVVLGGGSARAILKITRDVLTVDRLWRLSREIREHPSGVLALDEGEVI
jgi:exopolyphosphatase/pppGpp-phosphohydrolase